MSDTPLMQLPLLSPSQAQKHVTVNEALSRLDAVVQLRLVSVVTTTPPASPNEGEAWGVPPGASGPWAGEAGQIALWLNGGWAFIPAGFGWRAFVLETGAQAIFDGSGWRHDALSVLPSGAGLAVRSVELDVVIGAGPTVTTGTVFPDKSLVMGVTGRVITAISGACSTWRLGDAFSDDRFGNGLGIAQNSFVEGPVDPFVVYGDTPLVLTGEGGDFASGTVRIAAHYMAFTSPDAV